MNFVIEIKQTATLAIFDEPCVKEKADHLFNTYKEDIENRIQEILYFLKMEPCKELAHDNIAYYFKIYYYKSILYMAVENAVSIERKYNILENVLALLSVSSLAYAIRREPMIYAFSKAISSIPVKNALEKALHGSKIFLLEKEFLGITPPHISTCKVNRDFDEDEIEKLYEEMQKKE